MHGRVPFRCRGMVEGPTDRETVEAYFPVYHVVHTSRELLTPALTL